MTFRIFASSASLLLALLASPASASRLRAAPCPGGYICSSGLGLAVAPVAGTRLALPGQVPRADLAIVKKTARAKTAGKVRLEIAPLGLSKARPDSRAARWGMVILSRSVTTQRAPVAVRYSGAPGLQLVTYSAAGPAVTVVLAHNGAVYRITAPGSSSLAPDQRRMLSTLRFLPRSGPFSFSGGGRR